MNVRITGQADVKKMLQEIGRQAPYALSVALNSTANAVQQEIRKTLPTSFSMRKPEFISRTIYRKPGEDFATKAKTSAAVRVNDDPKRDHLAKFEEGGDKRPTSGSAVAIPLPGVRRNKSDVITTANRPKALKGKKGIVRLGNVIFKSTGRGKGKRLTALYLLKRSVRIRPVLHFDATARTVIDREWKQHAEAAVAKALATAK